MRYFLNSVVVTVGTTVPTVVLALMAAYAIVRGAHSALLKRVQGLFLMGLAIPLQAAIIPVYLLIIQLGLYDSLPAIVLPSIAFAIPLGRAGADRTSCATCRATCSSRCGSTGPTSGRCCGVWPSR